MPIKSPIFMFLTLVFLTSCLISMGYEVPYPRTELDRCVQRCHDTEKSSPVIIECAARCERKYGDKEWSGKGKSTGEKEDDEPPQDPKSPRWKIEQCQRQCREEETREREVKKCEKRCEEEVIKEREREQERGEERQHHQEKGEDRRSSSENSLTEVRTKENPYYIQSQKFRSSYKSQEGHLKILERFSKRSKLLRGLDNYRLTVFKANPNTFSVPHHCDAEAVFVVLKGKGTITFLLRGKRESYNVESYDGIRVPAGATVYSINRDSNEKLIVAALIKPVNTPGKFKGYFAAGGGNPELLYRAFSNDILETTLKIL